MEQRVIQRFHESIETIMNAGEGFAPMLADASHAMVQALLGEGKILTCGVGLAAANAQTLTNCLVNRFEQERPSLPALCLATDAMNLSAVASDSGLNDIFAKPIRGLGQAGDLLVVFATGGNTSATVQAISAARDKDMGIVAFTNEQCGDLSSMLASQDFELKVPTLSATHAHEVHLLSVFCLCDLIDQQLFGGFA